MRFEKVKIKSEPYFKLILIILSLFTLGSIVNDVRSYTYIEDLNSDHRERGLAAIKKLKQAAEKSAGELSIEKLNASLAIYKSHSYQYAALHAIESEYPGFYDLLQEAYGSYEEERGDLSGLESADDFYDRNKIIIKDYMEHKERYSEKESERIMTCLEKIKTPYLFNYNKQWRNLSVSLSAIALLVSFFAIIMGSRVFSIEKETSMDLLVRTRDRARNLRQNKNKFLAVFSLLTKMYLIPSFFAMGVTLSLFGLTGLTSQIQINFFTSLYSVNFIRLLLLQLLVQLLAVLVVASLSMLINARTYHSIKTIILTMLLTYLPLMVTRLFETNTTIGKLLRLLPATAFKFLTMINSLTTYSFFGISMLNAGALICSSLVLILGGYFTIPYLANRRGKR